MKLDQLSRVFNARAWGDGVRRSLDLAMPLGRLRAAVSGVGANWNQGSNSSLAYTMSPCAILLTLRVIILKPIIEIQE